MKIRNKILVYFSTVILGLMAIAFVGIYILFSEYREEEFQQQQKEKIHYTIRLLEEYKEMSEKLAGIMDELSIHDFFDEKMLIFDGEKNIIFSSIDDLPISNHAEILESVSPSRQWYETKQSEYDIIAIYTEFNQKNYYAISKAYDAFGYTKLYFLRNVLIGIFLSITVVIILISLLISNKISRPIRALAEKISQYEMGTANPEKLQIDTSSYELQLLSSRFNELLQRTNEAFTYQKHIVHHISHQLKTPIAVLVSELEKIKKYPDADQIKTQIEEQINKVKSLGSIINILLEISKIETGLEIQKQPFRVDEMIFDVIDELNLIFPDFRFEVNYVPLEINEEKLIVKANYQLIRQSFINLLSNCIAYSDENSAGIVLDCSDADVLRVRISNTGEPITPEEEKLLFNYFFRGKNSQGKIGFGLGMVLTKKILEFSSAKIRYINPSPELNVFELDFPLS